MIKLKVVNVPPQIEKDVPPELLDIFRKCLNHESIYPFTHQAEAWDKALKGESLYLVAGTAAGKSLAALVPLIYNIANNQSQKLVCMYPLRALLEDQLKIVYKLASILDLKDEVGVLKGGQYRTEVINTLTKKIIVATPDAVYWLFRRRTKYNSLMMYSLSHVDDFLLDEAHVFSGLALENIRLFIDRLNSIREKYLNKPPSKIHVLTATPTANISTMLNSEDKIFGRSKVAAVNFAVEELLHKGNVKFWQEQINKYTSSNFRRLVLVLNSARKAHQLFHTTHLLEQSIPLDIGWIPGEIFVNSFIELKTGHPEISLKDFMELPKISVRDLEDKKQHFTWNMDKWYEIFEIIKIEDIHISFIEDNFESPSTMNEWNECWQVLKDKLDKKIYNDLYSSWSNYKVKVHEDYFYKHPDMIESQNVSLHIKKLEQFGLGDCINALLEKWRNYIYHPYVRQWPDTSIPVFLYTGGMSHIDREGLVEAFNSSGIDKAILISTSAVEAGVDFDADLLITDCADAIKVIQRFGRVGRRSDAQSANRVILYANGNELGKLREVDKFEITREELNIILKECLGEIRRMDKSLYLDALHREITRQIGIAGIEITDQHEFTNNVMSAANLDWSYNLRGAEGQVELTGTGIQRGVFSTLPLIRGEELELVDNSFVLAKAFVTFEQLVKRNWIHEVDIDLYSIKFADVVAAVYKNNHWKVVSVKEIGKYSMEPVLCYGSLPLSKFSIEDRYKDIIGQYVDRNGKKIFLPKQWFIIISCRNVPATKKEKLLQMAECYPKDIAIRTVEKYILLTEQELGACVELYYRMVTL